MAEQDWLISATPPTPNGDLHVGHLSGPYLAADVFRRARLRLGDDAVYVCYGDDNQSYVLTTAKRLGTDPLMLMEQGNRDIKATLDAYRIGMDAYTRPDAAHDAAVGNAVRRLIQEGLIVEKSCDVLYDDATGQPLYESFADGYCACCLLSTKGGICESCGHPNDPVELIDLCGRRLSKVKPTETRKRLVLPIEAYRDELVAYYAEKRGTWRPHILHLVDELLSRVLADYPISHLSHWGIPIGLPGWEGHVVNVWAEMGLGLLHALSRHRTDSQMRAGHYVQFLGYDNSYFFAIVHPVLQFALRRAGVDEVKTADFIFTNEFYNLENQKFSTSKGHALWGRELLELISVDEARFYLSLHGPELAEGNFVLQDATAFIADEFTAPLRTIYDRLAAVAETGMARPGQTSALVSKLEARVRFFSEPEHFSSRELARLTHNILKFLAAFDMDAANETARAEFLALADFLASLLGVFCPGIAQDLRAHSRAHEAQREPKAVS